ncbi:hypothetical protein JHK82_033981 [Glycine max]|uniref:Pentatricopeptide repeat-containing protein n=2 Tax=Glycine subgen. Soja TaxID=1462606 RepID=K7LV55_SOYBN|nr:hypothetical protein JHK85_034691 [Glycine max]KAG4986364.1 hypothetical protein JHK86_034055 [Glycine max]KAG5119561.1 hypothetical protein JHK82_033981 [Glycine max]KAG5140552.1 hypothetical protein JHK84_034320 [Glycine max]RZB76027.1 Pentatricopeptide repeat-containing protein [Glycine soja]
MSMLRLRYALSIPRFPCFLVCCHPAITLHSWPLLFHNPNDVIVSFNRMLRECPTPPIFQFNKILGSLKLQFPGIVSFNIVINCFCHLRQINLAFFVLADILKIGYHPNTITFNTSLVGISPNVVIYNALIYGFFAHQLQEVIALFNKMKWKGINPYVCTFNRLVDAFGKEGKMKEVRNVGVSPNVNVSHNYCPRYGEMISRGLS